MLEHVKTLILLFLIGAILISCQPKDKQDEWDKQNMRDLYPSDQNVKAAVEKTQRDLDLLIKSYNDNADKNEYHFYIKSKFVDNEYIEHMWGTIIQLTDKEFKITIDNQPRDLKNIELGDTTIVSYQDVEDFMIYKGDSLILGDYLNKELKNAR